MFKDSILVVWWKTAYAWSVTVVQVNILLGGNVTTVRGRRGWSFKGVHRNVLPPVSRFGPAVRR